MTANTAGTKAGKSPFGIILTRLRTDRGLTQEGLALATEGDRISSRSITNYERNVSDARNWILPHRPAVQTLSEALNLDSTERRALVDAWNETRELKDAMVEAESTPGFITAGREAIIDQVLSTWQRALQGNPQFVLLGGDSGIGKTTISSYLSDRIAGSSKKVLISWGESHSWAMPIDPYLAIRHVTDRLLVPPPASFTLPGHYPNRPKLTESVIQSVMDTIPQLAGVLVSGSTIRTLAKTSDQMDEGSIEATLGSVLGTESFGRWEAYSNLLHAISQTGPLLVVLEDLHWSNTLAVSLLQFLVDNMGTRSNAPIMILGTFRSNELAPNDDGSPHPLSRFLNETSHLPNVTQIRMQDTLTEQNARSFVRAILGATPIQDPANEEELVDWLVTSTSGQPLFTVESIRHLRESQALKQVGRMNVWQFAPQAENDSVPTAITTLMKQRLTQIERRHRYVLEVAAAMDDSILTPVLADVVGMDEDVLLDEIDAVLVGRHEMLRPGPVFKSGKRSFSTYRFPHAMAREYVYSEIRQGRKRKIHMDIADAIERTFPDTDTLAMGEVAHHHVMAEDWHAAQLSAYRVAQLQSGRLDWELSTVWFDQAERMSVLAEDARQLWRARAARLVVMRGLSQYEEGLELGKNVLAQAEIHGWVHTASLAHHHMGEIYYDLGQLELSEHHIETALETHIQEQAYVLAAAAEAMLSHATYRQGKYDVARAHAQQSMAYTWETHNSWVRSEALLGAANCELDMGFYQEAINNYQASIELATMSGKLSNQFLPSLNIGLAYIFLRDYDRAYQQILETLERMKLVHVPRTYAWGRLYLGYALEGMGDVESALALYAECTAVRREFNTVPLLYDSVAAELGAAIALGNLDDARAHITEIVGYIDEHGLDGLEDAVHVLVTVARGYEALGEGDEYERRLDQAHALVLSRAALISDPEAVTSYLTRVPTNAEVLRRIQARKST